MADNLTNETLGTVLRDARVAKGWSLRELAKRIDKTPSYLSDIENDRRVPAEDVLQALADVLQISFDDLMARAGRFGDETVRYMKHTPAAGVLFRKLSNKKLAEKDLQKIAKFVDRLGGKGKR